MIWLRQRKRISAGPLRPGAFSFRQEGTSLYLCHAMQGKGEWCGVLGHKKGAAEIRGAGQFGDWD